MMKNINKARKKKQEKKCILKIKTQINKHYTTLFKTNKTKNGLRNI